MSTLYELYGILIHSGSAMGGHYHAYIKDVIATPDPAKCDDASAGWSDYNDSQVSPIDLPTLERMMCGTATAAASAPADADGNANADAVGDGGPQGGESATEATSSVENAAAVPSSVEPERWAGGSASNAYMLVYRLRSPQTDSASAPLAEGGGGLMDLLPQEVQSDIASEGYAPPFLEPFYTKNDRFIKTGSGQTSEN